MTNIELYINGILTDVGNSFSVRLNRKIIDPGELNTKDAQYSYSISLPPTDKNNRAFNYSNIEETKNKFNRDYKAELIINSVRIFVGNFRLSQVTNEGYTGNLFVPAVKTIKDIFGDTMLNENPELRIDFTDFAASITAMNNAALIGTPVAVFPYVLYGLLPKVPLNLNANVYSPRNVWDDSVRIGMSDIPPSINVLQMLQHIFNSNGYTLQGTAFSDEKLARLYMSYHNDPDYVQPWNYGHHATIKLNGLWSSAVNKRTNTNQFERGINQGFSSEGFGVYAVDIFDATNSKINITVDTGGNVLYKEVNDTDAKTWAQTQIRIPVSGFYKVKFGASIKVSTAENYRSTDPSNGIQHVGGISDHGENHMRLNIYEVKLLRDRVNADFGLTGATIDGSFYLENQPQNGTFDEDNIPKYFPQVLADGQINFIDVAQDQNAVLGFAFGRTNTNTFVNPRDISTKLAQIEVAKPALSWDTAQSDAPTNRIAINSPGYWKYGRIGDFDNEGDNPDHDIDYSGGTRVNGKVLDDAGLPVDPAGGNLGVRVAEYFINKNSGFLSINTDWEASDFIDLRNYTGITFSAIVSDNPDAAIVMYYDVNKQPLQVGIAGPAVGVTDTYTNQAILPPIDAVYVRFSGMVTDPMVIQGTDVTNENVILLDFPLDRYYTYVIDGGATYTGNAYIRVAGAATPTLIVPFVDGVAKFSTSGFSADQPAPVLTLYLATHSFSVDGVLTIDRTIESGSEDVVDWEVSDKYKIDLINAPSNYAKRGQYNNVAADADWNGQGEVNAVVWFEAGELLTVASVSREGRYRRAGMHTTFGITDHDVIFDLEIEPFRIDADWLKVSLSGNGTAMMDWNDPINFDVDSINLTAFLAADIKTNDFIDNFVKAFNLNLIAIGNNAYSLDVKQSKAAVSNLFVDLDNISSVRERTNTPLGLPASYKLGFTIDTDEEGYVESGDDGGGEYDTGSIEAETVEQKSFFSYNWFKGITKDGNVDLQLPVITKHEAWVLTTAYPDAMAKRYTNLAYRFWYFDGLLNDQGTAFIFNGINIDLARVSNVIPNTSILNYKNQRYTILDNYFTLLINSSSHYTEATAYLTAAQYKKLDGAILGKFNGDLYYIAELTGYDPTGKNKTTIKLIRLI